MTDRQNPDHIGHRVRLKEKYKKAGLDGWLDYEVMELALTYAIARKDTKPIARKLMKRFKTFSGVLDADLKELEAIDGISEHTALFLKLLKDAAVLYLKGGLYKTDLMSSPEAVVDYLKASMKGCADEEFRALFLDGGNKLISIEIMQTGIVNRSAVYPRKIVERALYHHAAGVIVVHNHPAGTLKPSGDDCAVTRALKDALDTVEIHLLDHIIIAGPNYFSFKEKALM